ncbi:MAG: ATP-grasp domain-containing protein [Planctomycetota bacterium]|nr:MAG: ATP-grasp domain-containing protein [Planctomycetota bacterium]
MAKVVFVAPFAMDSTLRFVRAAAQLPEIQLGLLSQEPFERVPGDLRKHLAAFHRIQNALDPDQLEQGVRKLAAELGGEVDRLIGILEQMQEPMAEVRQRLGISGMDLKTAANFRDKARMKDLFRKHGLPCAQHCLAENAKTARDFARKVGFPLVGKPPAGAGAQNTFRLESGEELNQVLQSMPPSPGKPMLLEEFMTGQEFSFDTVTVGGRHVLSSISQYFPSPLEVLETPWIQWCVILPREIEVPEFADIFQVGRKALDAMGMQEGLTHMEWFRRPDGGLAISEVAARPPGAQFTSLLSYAHDFDFYQAWARLVSTGHFEIPERQFSAGAAYLRGQGGGRVQGLAGLQEAQKAMGDLVVEAKLPQEGQPKSSSYEGEGYVIVRHPETEVVKDALRQLIGMVQVEMH